MQAEIITIGDEILIGQTVDTNSAFIAEELNKLGLSIAQITSISDTRDHILQALSEAEQRSDLIIMTGGLGPTIDDITKETLCEYFNTKLVMNPDVLQDIESFFQRIGREMLEVNKNQAMLPESAAIIRNRRGTASGMWFEKSGRVFISMPGVPYEMRGLMEDEILSKIRDHFNSPAIYHRTMLTWGIGESFLSEMAKEWENSLEKEGVKIAYLPSPGMVRVRLSAFGETFEPLAEKVDRKAQEFYKIAGEYIFGEGKQKPAEVIGTELLKRGQKLSTAESCTGGYLAHLVTSIPGSSEYYMGSSITYGYEAKSDILNVEQELFDTVGAVSEEVVKQMAIGASELFGTEYALALSGIAGPGGGTEDKPVGTVWVALKSPEGVEAQRFQFGRNRERNIHQSALAALRMLHSRMFDKSFVVE